MPAKQISKTGKQKYVAKFVPPNLDIGVINPNEFKTSKDYKKTLHNFFRLDIAALNGVGPKLAKELRAMNIPTIGVFYYDLRFTQRKRNKILKLLEDYPIAKKEANKILKTRNENFLSVLKSYKRKHKSGSAPPITDESLIQEILNDSRDFLEKYFGI